MSAMGDKIAVLDHGYVQLVETWGSDERIIEAARMSTDKGFQGWGTDRMLECPVHGLIEGDYRKGDIIYPQEHCIKCWGTDKSGQTLKATTRGIGDEKLLRYLYEHKHMTPFEMAGMIVEVQAPIFVFREWHRHRTQCLGPDTLIHFDAPKSDRLGRRSVYKMRIEDIWRKWQPTTRSARPERQINALFPRSRIQAMKLRRLNESTGEFEHTTIVDVIKGNPKPMIEVTVASGRRLTATAEHRVFTDHGWMALGAAIESQARLAVEGTSRGLSMRWEVAIRTDREIWLAISEWEGLYDVSSWGRVRRVGCEPKRPTINRQGYDVVSLSHNGVTWLLIVHQLVLNAFVGVAPGEQARHKDHNRANNAADNLVWGAPQDNTNDQMDADRHSRLVPVFEEISTYRNAGTLPTFDLTVAGPHHNFSADGFVVHNSYNELSARYTPLPDVNYVPSVERLMMTGGTNKQMLGTGGSMTSEKANNFRRIVASYYGTLQVEYQAFLDYGVPKELARLLLPVGRYSRMRASANLRNWLQFLTLRMDPAAQWEIRQYANAVADLIGDAFPRTHQLFTETR